MDNERTGVCYTEQIYIIRPQHLNGQNRLFGGQLMMWIDEIAAVSAKRYCNGSITTACVDKLDFLGSAHLDDFIVLTSEISYVGNTSMEVTVHTYTEKLDGTRIPINVAYLVEVAIDENERPRKVRPYEPKTEREKAIFEAGELRNQIRKERRKYGL